MMELLIGKHIKIAMTAPETTQAVAVTDAECRDRLRQILDVVRKYLPPDGITKDAALDEIIGLLDPWAIGLDVAVKPGDASQDANDLDDMLVVRHLNPRAAGETLRQAIDRIINWEVMVNLDPSVCSTAQALVDKGRDEGLVSVIQVLNQNPYSLTKSECIHVVQGMRELSRDAAKAIESEHNSPADLAERMQRLADTPTASRYTEVLRKTCGVIAGYLRRMSTMDGLVGALKAMTERYCDLVNSGDAGYWDPECDEPVQRARAVIAASAADAAAVDEKLGLVLLPPIRVNAAVHAALSRIANQRGLILQALVRELLGPAEAVGDAEAMAADRTYWRDEVSIKDLRQAKWLDPQCADRGACQSLVFKATPIDMVLHCPACGMQHIDAPESDAYQRHASEAGKDLQTPWLNPPHRSHLCHGCGHIWRPADVATNGVAAVKSKGKDDSGIEKDRLRAWPVPDDIAQPPQPFVHILSETKP